MFMLILACIGVVVWLRRARRDQDEMTRDVALDPSNAFQRLMGHLAVMRTSKVLIIGIPLLLGYVLDQLFNTSIKDLFG